MMDTRAIDTTTQYLQQHHIPLLVESITTALLLKQPENPRQFILQHLTLLEDYKAGKSSKHPLLIFNEGDLSAYFQILDVQKKGCIEKETYQQAAKMLGVEPVECQETVKSAQFVTWLMEGIRKKNQM